MVKIANRINLWRTAYKWIIINVVYNEGCRAALLSFCFQFRFKSNQFLLFITQQSFKQDRTHDQPSVTILVEIDY